MAGPLRARQGAQTMTVVRWLALPWGVLILVTHGVPPYPPGVFEAGIGLLALLAVTNVVIALMVRRDLASKWWPRIALVGLAVDVFVVGGFVWLHAFDHTGANWTLLFILPLEGAALFALPGALGTWTATFLVYTGRELWGSDRYDYVFSWNSVAFRMGIGLFIAVVAGMMARNLWRERAQLAATLTELQHVDEWRRRLLGALAHDVRSPLSTIRGTLQTLRSDQLPSGQAPTLLEMADRQAARLERLAHGLLDLARLEEGRLELDLVPVNLSSAVRTAVDSLSGGASVTVDVPSERWVRADPDRLEQILMNLIDNASRHGSPPIVIDTAPEEAAVGVRVWDHGPGLDEAGEDWTPSHGYGLTIVRALAAAQGGELRYRRADGRTCFELVLPTTEPAGSPLTPTRSDSRQ